MLELTNGKTRQLTSGGAVNVEPRWSPDGKRIAWVSTQYNKRFHVFMADVANGELKNMVRLTGETKSPLPRYYYSAYDMEINPVWTREGKEILFVSNRGHIYGTGGFWRMKAEPGAEAREIHYEETSWKARPDFSPDGSRMVYSSYLGRQWHNLWLMPANGGDAFPLSYGDWDETNARWSPDGKSIASVANYDGNTQLWLQTATGAERHSLRVNQRRYMRPHGDLFISVVDERGGSVHARLSVTSADGRFYSPNHALVHADDGYDRAERASERHYIHSGVLSEVHVPSGKITIDALHGFEYAAASRTLDVVGGSEIHVELRLKPISNEKTWRHWISGDLHVHMNYGGTYKNEPSNLIRQGNAEGVAVINELTVNKEQRFPDVQFLDFGGEKHEGLGAQIVQGQEFHTSYWGHRGILDIRDHLLLPGYAGYPNTAAASLYPMNADVYDMAHEQGALVGAVHPFDEVPDPFAKPAQKITDELPVDVALGKLDYMEIVGFSDHKSTAAVWYKLLNLGFKLPAGGGTDATADYAAPIRGQVGFDRVYVWVPVWPLNLKEWLDGIVKGRTFATNGPLIEFKLGGEMVGNELKFDAAQGGVSFTAKLRSIVPVDHLEVVCNGKVARELKLEGRRDTADAKGTIPLNESGWCVLRTWSEKAEYPVMDKYEYATTSPVYVTIGGKRAYAREDAEYFKAWIERTIEVTEKYPDWNSAAEKELVMKRLREARGVYEGMK